MGALTDDIKDVMLNTWPMIVLTTAVLISLRIVYLIKNRKKIVLSKDLMILLFVVYILCMFQIVTSQDVSGIHGINITFFKELTRYRIGSHLFYRNIVGNIIMFIPFGFFTSFYLRLDKKGYALLLTFITSMVIEFIQLKIGRAFDVDDLILNLIGGLIGYLLYRLNNIIFKNVQEKTRDIITLILIIIIIVSLMIIVI